MATGADSDGPSGSAALRALSEQLRGRIDAFLAEEVDEGVLRRTQAQTRHSLGIIEEAVRRFGLDSLALSYNGGKDCLVLLVLYLAALPGVVGAQSAPDTKPVRSPNVGALLASALNRSDSGAPSSAASTPPRTPHPELASGGPDAVPATSPLALPPLTPDRPRYPALLRSIYIVSPHPFPQVDDFVARTASAYRLALARRSDPNMRAAFAIYLADHPAVRAIFVGTRRTDPHGATLQDFHHTDQGWPAFMRVHPMLEWRYAEIWAFILHLNIPYCELYDAGYTSLGGTKDTLPNPVLRVQGDDGVERFKPAYELELDEQERLGRS